MTFNANLTKMTSDQLLSSLLNEIEEMKSKQVGKSKFES